MSDKRPVYLVLFVVILVALAMRLYPIGANLPYTYWHDENNYVEDAMRMGKGSFEPAAYYHGGLYQLILFLLYGAYYFFMRIAGIIQSPMAFLIGYIKDPSVFFIIARSVSALCGTALVYLSYLISARIFTRRAALVSAIFMAFSLLMFQMSIFALADVPSVLFLAISFLCVVRSVQAVSDRRLYYAAAIFAGLAASAKYFSVFGVVFIYVAAFLKYRDEDRRGSPFALVSMLVSASSLAMVGFFMGIPSALFNLARFYNDTIAMGGVYVASDPHKYKWLYIFTNHFRNGLGIPLELVFICGLGYAFLKRSKWDLLLLAFPVAHYLVFMNSTGFAYHLIPSVFFVSILAGRFLDSMIAMTPLKKSILAAIIAALIVVSPSLYETIKLVGVIMGSDTRTMAKSWVEKNIKSGSVIMEEGYVSEAAVNAPQLICDEPCIERELKQIISRGANGYLQKIKMAHFKELYAGATVYDVEKMEHLKADDLSSYPEYVIISNNNDMPIGEELGYSFKYPYFASYFENRKAMKDELIKKYDLEKSFIPMGEFTAIFPHLMNQDYALLRKIRFNELKAYVRGPKIDIYKRKIYQ